MGQGLSAHPAGGLRFCQLCLAFLWLLLPRLFGLPLLPGPPALLPGIPSPISPWNTSNNSHHLLTTHHMH